MMTPEVQPVWRKSSFSTDQANCVEVGAWHKSSYSTSESNCVEVGAWQKSSYSSTEANCVEIATSPVEVGVRDTKDRAAGHLTVSAEAWGSLVTVLAR